MTTANKQVLLTEHYLDFFNRAVAILDDEQDAQDAVQEAVVKTLVRIGVRDPVAYCHRATVNQCISMLRRRKRTTRLEEMRVLTSYDEDRIVHMVNEGLDTLLPLERAALQYFHQDGVTQAEIAATMNVSVSTVKRLIARAEEKMKKYLNE